MELFNVAGFDVETSGINCLICIVLESAAFPGSPVVNRDLDRYQMGLGEETCDFHLNWSSGKLLVGLWCEGLGQFHPEHVMVHSSLSVNIQWTAPSLTTPRFNTHGTCLALAGIQYL